MSGYTSQEWNKKHTLLRGYNKGINKKLIGNVGIFYIIAVENEYRVGTGYHDPFFDIVNFDFIDANYKAINFLTASAKEHGVELILTYETKIAKIDSDVGDNDLSCAVANKILKSIGYDDLKHFHKDVKKQNALDDVIICFIFPNKGRSCAFKSFSENGSECIFIMQPYSYKTIVHEILHLYGAVDFYYNKRISKIVRKNLGLSIMEIPLITTIDDFTAYVIGWDTIMNATLLKFLKSTDYITPKMWDALVKKESFCGDGKKKYADGRIYQGELKSGQPHGNGKMKYMNGDVYIGEFEYGVPNGKGKRRKLFRKPKYELWKDGVLVTDNNVQYSP